MTRTQAVVACAALSFSPRRFPVHQDARIQGDQGCNQDRVEETGLLMHPRLIRTLQILIILVVNIAFDQITKSIARQAIHPNEVIHVVGDFFILTHAENDGAFLSMFSGLTPALKVIFLIAFPLGAMLAVLVFAILKRSISFGTVFGLACIVGGGISNLYDRILHDMFVFDFMNMGIGRLRTGIFNFADVSIMLGIGIILLADYLPKKADRAAA